MSVNTARIPVKGRASFFLPLSEVDGECCVICATTIVGRPMDATALAIIIAASFAAGYGVRAYRAARRRRIFRT